MREILFKAKRVDNGEWVEGYLFDDGFIDSGRMFVGSFVVERCKSTDDWKITGINFYEVDPFTICQYTGLTDKNGNKIWENDIVKRTVLRSVKEPSVGFLEYDAENTAFLIHWIDVARYSPTYLWKEKIEIIGNIFDNPELVVKE